MPFSFNPGQVANQNQGGIASQTPVAGVPLGADTPSVPDSPFLFIQQRGKELTVNAYLQIVLLVAALLSIIAALTLFVYGFYLKSSLESKKQELATREASFKEYPISDMRKLSVRAAAVDQLLKGYVSIRSPLKLLEDVVEKQVTFESFVINREKSGGYIANFVAVTKDYLSLIQQLEALKLTQYSKVAPDTKLDKFSEEKNSVLKVRIMTPVFVQGVLPDDIVFVQPAASTTQSLDQQAVNQQ